MAEYYPLLARAVAALPNSSPDSRRSIYDRARAALIAQLRAVQPPIAEDDIQRESRMLDEAIAQLEAEADAAAKAPAPAVEASSSPPAPSRAPDVRPDSKIGGGLAPESRKLAEPLVKRPEAGSNIPARLAAAARPLSGSGGLPPRPSAEKSLGALEAARQRLANLARSASSRPATPVTLPKPPTLPPALEHGKPAVAFTLPTPGERPLSAQRPAPEPVEQLDPLASPAEPHAETVEAPTIVTGAEPQASDMAAPEPILRKYGPRAEAAAVADQAATVTPAGRADDEDGNRGPSHPAAPLPASEKTRNLRPLLIGGPVLMIVAAIAYLGWKNRDNPDEIAKLRPAPGVEAPADAAQGDKIVERIGGGAKQIVRPSASQTQLGQAPQVLPQSGTQAVPVAQRAALLLDAPDDPQRVKTFVGNVVWRLDNVSRGPGQPLAVGVRAEIDLPDAKLKAVMLFQKNTDETLPASHTIELRFTPADGSVVPGIAQIQTPQLRSEDTPSGDPLAGVPTPILRNFFLVGLARGGPAETRNIELIRNRGWFDVPMLLTDQRIAKITFEKGSAGERIIKEAFDAWK